MVACPNAIDRFIEDALAGSNRKCWPSMPATADEDIVDPAKGPVPVFHQSVARCERVTWLLGMRALPGVAVTDTHSTQRLSPGPETYACGGRVGVKIAGQHDMHISL